MNSSIEIQKLLDYNPSTGIFRWKTSRGTRRIGSIAGTSNHEGYISIQINKKIHRAANLAWVVTHGCHPSGIIDHINGVTSDNRICNLRDVSIRDNGRNQKIRSTNKTGIMGVQALRGKYQVRIRDNNKELYLGYFGDFFEACCVRKSAERKYGYHENHNNR